MDSVPVFRRGRDLPRRSLPKQSEIEREGRKERGRGDDLARLLNAFRRERPFCRFCLQEGFTTVLATGVDHIVPLVDHPGGRLDVENLQSLCDRHHFGTKARLERIARAVGDVFLLVKWCSSLAEREATKKIRI